MHIADYHLDTGDDVHLLRSSLLLRKWPHRIKLNSLSTLHSTTKEPLPLEALILLHLRPRDLGPHIWFVTALHLAVNILLGTSFVHRFIRGIFTSKCIAVH